MRKKAGINGCIALAIAAAAGWSGLVPAAEIDSWNSDNVVTDLPPHVPGVTYDSKLFTSVPRLETNGAVIWKEGSVVAPGAQVLTDSPEGSGNNCIITTGTDRSDPTSPPKTCSDAFQSAKRVKLDARAAGTGTIVPDPNGEIDLLDGKPLDMVFNATALDGDWRTYRVFKKYINGTGQRTDGFVVELGFGSGEDFVASGDNDGLRFSPRPKGNNPNAPVFEPLPVYSTPPGNSDLGALMSAGLFGDADDIGNRTIDGYFAVPELELDGCLTDPSGTGRSYYNLVVRSEDRIETVGDVQGLHYCLFGNMLPQGELPLGYFWDGDGDPDTDADTVADWQGDGNSLACNGTPCWQTYVVLCADPATQGDCSLGEPILDQFGNFTRPADPPVPVPENVLDHWAANPDTGDGVTVFYFITELDDMGLVNNNYHITVEGISGWPTYDSGTGTATFTMRTSNVGEGTAFDAPWLNTLPPELDVPTPQVDGAITDLSVPASVTSGETVQISVTVANTLAGQDPASGQVIGEARDAAGELIASFLGEFVDLAPGTSTSFAFDWLVTDPTGLPDEVTWTVTVVADGEDLDGTNNTDTAVVSINGDVEPAVDAAIKDLQVDRRVKANERADVKVYVVNFGPNPASGSVSVTGTDHKGNEIASFSEQFTDLERNDELEVDWDWTAPSKRTTVTWLATVTAAGDTDLDNNTATATTRVVK